MEANEGFSLRYTADVICEFLEVSFHLLLFLRGVYPPHLFDRRSKYGVPLQQCRNKEVSEYVAELIFGVRDCIDKRALDKVAFIVEDENQKPLERYVFEINVLVDSISRRNNETTVQSHLRELIKKLSVVDAFLPPLDQKLSFHVLVYTGHSSSVSSSIPRSANTTFESFKQNAWINVSSEENIEFDTPQSILLKTLKNESFTLNLIVQKPAE